MQMKHEFSKDPLLQIYWEEYDACRNYQFQAFKRPKGQKNEILVQVVFPSGFSVLPYEGGWSNQPFIYTIVFRSFLHGERKGVLSRANQ